MWEMVDMLCKPGLGWKLGLGWGKIGEKLGNRSLVWGKKGKILGKGFWVGEMMENSTNQGLQQGRFFGGNRGKCWEPAFWVGESGGRCKVMDQ